VKHYLFGAVLSLALAASTPVYAEKPIEGVVVDTADGEVIVDLGAADGIPQSPIVQVYRRLEVTHPVTGKKIVDRFPIGSMRLEQVGDELSLTRQWTDLKRPPQKGDYVVWEPPIGSPVVTPEPLPARPDVPLDPESDALESAFRASLGRSLPDRIAIYERFLRADPASRHVEAVRNELHWLRTTLETQREEPRAEAKLEAEPRVGGLTTGPPEVEAGTPIYIESFAEDPELVSEMRVHVRTLGSPAFQSIPMERVGDHNWRATLEGAAWNEPAELQYFVEAVRPDEQLERIGVEQLTEVTPPPTDPRGPNDRSRASMLGEYVNFKSGAGDDEFARFEAEYRYDIGLPVLDGFTAGAGIFRGTGGTVRSIQAGEAPRRLNLSYGFAEVDLEFLRYFGLTTRFLLGNHQELSLEQGILDDAFGFGAELWFGEADRTHLVLGGSFTEGIGAEAWIRLAIDAIERVPMTADVEVTNLPVGADLGVSLNYGIGYAFTDWFTLMGRLGWNARTIDHHGPTAGLATVFEW